MCILLGTEEKINFGDIDPIFKIIGGHKKVKNDLLTPYLLKK